MKDTYRRDHRLDLERIYFTLGRLDLFEHGERDVVEKVFLVCFPLISLTKNQVSSLNEKGVEAAVLGPESSDTETKDAGFLR